MAKSFNSANSRNNQNPSLDPAIASLRIPPHSIEAEQSVLGGLLLDNAAFDKIADLVGENDFYRDEHKRIYRQIRKLLEQSKPVDVITVAESLDLAGRAAKRAGWHILANWPPIPRRRRISGVMPRSCGNARFFASW